MEPGQNLEEPKTARRPPQAALLAQWRALRLPGSDHWREGDSGEAAFK